MPLLDSILDWFRRKPKDTSTQTSTNTREVPTPMAESIVNSITLSPDLSTLYLIDNGNAIPFDLNTELGVVIGTLDGQLTVASALPDIVVPTPDDDDDVPDDEDGPTGGPIERLAIDIDPGNGPIRRVGTIAKRKHLKLSTQKTFWTVMFVKEKGVLSIIGASDIDLNIIGASDIDLNIIGASDIDLNIARPRSTEQSDTTKTKESETKNTTSNSGQIYSFLITKNTINIKKVGDIIVIAY